MSSKKKLCGRKRKVFSNIANKIREVPFHKRGTIRSLAAQVGMKPSTVFNFVKRKELKAHSSAVKPYLTPQNMQARIEFCKSHIDLQKSMFSEMNDVVHIDEKWFYLTENSRRFYLMDDEEAPERKTKSKRFRTKVMFLCAVARPRYDFCAKQNFDGKIGIWPFTKIEPAQRSSANRPAGTLVTKPVTSVTNIEYRQFLIQKVLPAIKSKFPTLPEGKSIKLQQDNARPHISPSDHEFIQAATTLELDICITCQPPNSPDLNVLDLGFFNSIQSLQHQTAPTNIEELISAVDDSFQSLPSKKLTNVFLTLQKVMEAVIICDGDNKYKVPHMSKLRLERMGELPVAIVLSNRLKQKLGLQED